MAAYSDIVIIISFVIEIPGLKFWLLGEGVKATDAAAAKTSMGRML